MTPGEDIDEKDIRLTGEGSSPALQRLYSRHIRYLAAVAGRYLVSEDDLKDVLQEAFVKIFTQASTFQYRGRGSVRAWMVRIVINEALLFLRHENRPETVMPDDLLPDTEETDGEPDVADVPAEAIWSMVRQLPKGYRMVFNLYVFEHRSHKEIAGMLNITESTSASQLHKAKSLLAKRITEYKTTRHE